MDLIDLIYKVSVPVLGAYIILYTNQFQLPYPLVLIWRFHNLNIWNIWGKYIEKPQSVWDQIRVDWFFYNLHGYYKWKRALNCPDAYPGSKMELTKDYFLVGSKLLEIIQRNSTILPKKYNTELQIVLSFYEDFFVGEIDSDYLWLFHCAVQTRFGFKHTEERIDLIFEVIYKKCRLQRRFLAQHQIERLLNITIPFFLDDSSLQEFENEIYSKWKLLRDQRYLEVNGTLNEFPDFIGDLFKEYLLK